MNPCLTASAQPSANSRRPKVDKGLNVGEHTPGLIECADHVLGLGQVDRRLAADRGIHHSSHAGGNLHEGNAAQESGGHEPGQVPNDSAAHGNDGMAPLRLEAKQPVVDRLGLLEVLAGFSRRDDKAVSRDAAFLQGALRLPPIGVHDVGVGQDVSGFIQTQGNQPVSQRIQQPPAGDNRVASSRMMDRGRQVRVGHLVSSESSSFVLQISRAASATCSSVRSSVFNVWWAWA